MATSALDSGRQRTLLQQAQAIITDLKALPLDPDTSRRSYPRMFDLVRLVKRFVEATASMPADETRTMWEQRGQWLQEEVAALASERVYSPDQQQHWLNLVLLLFAAADACDRVLREKVELEAALETSKKREAELEHWIKEKDQQLLQAAQATSVPAAVQDELLELRSKVVVLQQELQKQAAQTQVAAQPLQLLTAERDRLQHQVDELHKENALLQEAADNRAEVIQQLMAQHESSASRHQQLAAEHAKLTTHCKALGVNLETNAKVIEKLIELNTELMDTMNTSRLLQHQQQQQQQQALHAASTQNSPHAPNGLTSHAHHVQLSTSYASSPSASAAQAVHMGGQSLASSSTIQPSTHRQPLQPSLTDAFTAFLTAQDAPPPATADMLAVPVTSNASKVTDKGGGRGWLSRLVGRGKEPDASAELAGDDKLPV